MSETAWNTVKASGTGAAFELFFGYPDEGALAGTVEQLVTDQVTVMWLLALTFVISIGGTMNMPPWTALTPEVARTTVQSMDVEVSRRIASSRSGGDPGGPCRKAASIPLPTTEILSGRTAPLARRVSRTVGLTATVWSARRGSQRSSERPSHLAAAGGTSLRCEGSSAASVVCAS